MKTPTYKEYAEESERLSAAIPAPIPGRRQDGFDPRAADRRAKAIREISDAHNRTAADVWREALRLIHAGGIDCACATSCQCAAIVENAFTIAYEKVTKG